MDKIKNMTKKQKTIAVVTVAGLVLTGGVIGIVSSMDNGFDNTPTEQVSPEKSELKLTLEYKETPKDEYKVKMGEEELIITTAEITPEIDTSEIGTSKHTIEIDEKAFDLTIEIVDNRELTLNDFTELTVETESTQEDLEAKLVEELTPELDEGEELQFKFSYSDDFKLDVEGEYEVEATANFESNRRNTAKQTVLVKVVTPEEEPEEEVVADNSGSTGQTESTGGSSSSGSTGGSSNSSSSSGSSGSSSSGSSGSSGSSSSGGSSSSSNTSTPAKKPASSGGGGEGLSKPNGNGDDRPPHRDPAPEPEPKPEPKPTTPAPSGVPSGAKLTRDDGMGGYLYSISRNIPNGGTVIEVAVTTTDKSVQFRGVDNAGIAYGARVGRNIEYIQYVGNYPTLSDEDKEFLRDLGNQFLVAYGL